MLNKEKGHRDVERVLHLIYITTDKSKFQIKVSNKIHSFMLHPNRGGWDLLTMSQPKRRWDELLLDKHVISPWLCQSQCFDSRQPVWAASVSACSGSRAWRTGSLRTGSAASWTRRRRGSPHQLDACYSAWGTRWKGKEKDLQLWLLKFLKTCFHAENFIPPRLHKISTEVDMLNIEPLTYEIIH